MSLLLLMFCFVTFVQFDAFVLNKSINFFQKNSYWSKTYEYW